MDLDSVEALNIRLTVAQLVVNTLIRTHPDPAHLAATWASLVADMAVTDVLNRPVGSGEQAALLKLAIDQWTDLIQKQTQGG
jgi:hypothetical protein